MTKARITLYQHAWSAREYEPDGGPYGSEAEAYDAQAKRAREFLTDFSGDDLADYLQQHVKADEIDDSRFEAIRGGAELTEDEAVWAAEEAVGYDSAVYPVLVEVEAEALLAEIVLACGPHTPSAAILLETGAVLAQQAYDRWERGDLASTVDALSQWADDVRTALPGLDYTPDPDESLDDEEEEEDEDEITGLPLEAVKALKVGDLVRVLHPVEGGVCCQDGEEIEVELPARAVARIAQIDTFPAPQGYALTLVFDNGIVNVFDQGDDPPFGFVPVTPTAELFRERIAFLERHSPPEYPADELARDIAGLRQEALDAGCPVDEVTNGPVCDTGP